MTVLGTRPEIIRLSKIIQIFDNYFDHYLVNTNQNFDTNLNKVFFKTMNLREPNVTFKKNRISLANSISSIFINTEKLIKKIKPDAFFILGDTNSALSSIIAKRYSIPVFHMEAGNRAFDKRVPEEINRKIIDHLADINLTYSKLAKQNLINEGLSQDKIFNVGSPLYEVIELYKPKIKESRILNRLNLDSKSYFLISFHRQENLDNISRFKYIIGIINKLSKLYKNKKILISTHPRTRMKFKNLNLSFDKNIIISEPFNFIDYIKLQENAFCVISDSGSISEEASILKFPAINLRETNERQEAMEEGAVPMLTSDINKSLFVIKCVIDSYSLIKTPNEYLSPNLSYKLSKIIMSYIDYSKNRI